MVKSVNTQGNNNYGTINKIGTTENGRSVYQISDGTGKIAGRLSVAAKDCDTFEKSYETILNAAPKLQKFAENTTPENIASSLINPLDILDFKQKELSDTEAEKIKNGQALVTNEYCDGEFVCLKKNNNLYAIAQKDDSKNLLITKKVFI